MLVTKSEFFASLRAAAEKWLENIDQLSEIDSHYGDGDHGVTMGKMARLILKKTEETEAADLGEFLDELSMDILAINGGSAGPLYGTLIAGLGEALDGEQEIDGKLLKEMLASSLAAMREITPADIGDKTMMDALIPAVNAAQAAGDDLAEILSVASNAAREGAENTRAFAAKYGRARSYGEETVGTVDAGALSTSLFFAGLMEGLLDSA